MNTASRVVLTILPVLVEMALTMLVLAGPLLGIWWALLSLLVIAALVATWWYPRWLPRSRVD